jgi:hypothetical protein
MPPRASRFRHLYAKRQKRREVKYEDVAAEVAARWMSFRAADTGAAEPSSGRSVRRFRRATNGANARRSAMLPTAPTPDTSAARNYVAHDSAWGMLLLPAAIPEHVANAISVLLSRFAPTVSAVAVRPQQQQSEYRGDAPAYVSVNVPNFVPASADVNPFVSAYN